MKKKILKSKTFEYSLLCIQCYQEIKSRKKEFILSKQFLKSSTSIGAMVRESEYAESRKDFIHKLSIAQKEANETLYWIELLFRSDYIQSNEFEKTM